MLCHTGRSPRRKGSLVGGFSPDNIEVSWGFSSHLQEHIRNHQPDLKQFLSTSFQFHKSSLKSTSSTSISSKGAKPSSSSSTISTKPGMLAVGLRKLWISKRGGSGICDTILATTSRASHLAINKIKKLDCIRKPKLPRKKTGCQICSHGFMVQNHIWQVACSHWRT